MKCLITDAVYPGIAEELSRYIDVATTEGRPLSKAEMIEKIGEYDILIMRVDPKIDREILDAAKNLKMIGVCAVGTNHIDMEYAKEKGIEVFNAPGMNANAVAELSIAKMLEISRNTIPANYDVKVNHNWDKYKFVGRELRGKTLGIMGFGRIGRRGGIVNEQDMYEALKEGRIGGYAADVLENELAGSGLTGNDEFVNPLFECDNFIITPHLGAQSEDAARDVGIYITGKVKDMLGLNKEEV